MLSKRAHPGGIVARNARFWKRVTRAPPEGKPKGTPVVHLQPPGAKRDRSGNISNDYAGIMHSSM